MSNEKLTKVGINIRPPKYAYFVKRDDQEQFKKIIELTSTQWGGIRNLIIPIEDQGQINSYYKRLLKLHEPDWFINFLSEDWQAGNELMLHTLRELFPDRLISLQNGKAFQDTDNTAHALHVIDESTFLANRFYHRILSNSDDELASLVLFGAIYPGQEDFYRETARISIDNIDLNSIYFWRAQLERNESSSVINITEHGIISKDIRGDFFIATDYFDIVFHDSIYSLYLFWNQRATRESGQLFRESSDPRRVLLLPAKLVKNQEMLNMLFELIRRNLNRGPSKSNLNICFLCENANSINILKPYLESNPLIEIFSGKLQLRFSDQTESVPESTSKLTYRIGPFPTHPSSFKEGIARNIQLPIVIKPGSNELLYEPSPGFRNKNAGTVAVDIETPYWGIYPKNHQVSELVDPNAWFSKYGVTSLRTMIDRPAYLKLNFPTQWEIIEAFFKKSGFKIRNSKSGKYSQSLLDLIGGINGIEAISTRQAWALLDTLALKSSKKISQKIIKALNLKDIDPQVIEKLFDGFEISQELKGIPKTYQQMFTNPDLPKKELLKLLQLLSDYQLLKRGFYIDCPNCGMLDWYPIEIVGEKITCNGCSHRFILPVTDEHNANEVRWRYRLNSLMNRVMDQDLLPGLLAVNKIAKNKEILGPYFALELLRGEELITDIDFIFVLLSEVHSGECKIGASLSDKDIDNALLAANLGIKNHYFCSLNVFDKDAKDKIFNCQTELILEGYETKLHILDAEALFQ